MQSLPLLLIVDDNDDDIFFLRAALKKVGLQFSIQEMRNGVEAMEYLAGAGRFANRQAFPFPTLMILDLQMPVFDGFALLDWMSLQSSPRPSTIVVLSALARPADIERVSATRTALAYFVKSHSSESMVAAARCLRDWAQHNRLFNLGQPAAG